MTEKDSRIYFHYAGDSGDYLPVEAQVAYLFTYLLFILTQDMLIDFREGGEEKEKEGEKHQCEREALISCLSQSTEYQTHNPGTWNPQPSSLQDDAKQARAK